MSIIKSLFFSGILLLLSGSAHAISDNPAGVDFGSIQCTGIYRLGLHFEYNCTTGVLSIDTVTANTIIYQTLISTAGFSVEDFLLELNISTQSLAAQVFTLDQSIFTLDQSTTALAVRVTDLETSTAALATDKMDRNGLINQGLLTNAQIQILVCPIVTRGACWVTSSDEGDRYDSQSSTPGDYRNGRTGKDP